MKISLFQVWECIASVSRTHCRFKCEDEQLLGAAHTAGSNVRVSSPWELHMLQAN